MEYHGNELNSLVSNEIELGMMILMIRSQTNDGIKVTKGIGLNVYVQRDMYIRGIHMGHYGHPGPADDH